MMPDLTGSRLIIALAGSNGAGKSTFHQTYVAATGLRFVNADVIALTQSLGPYEAATAAANLRAELIAQGDSFAFETVLSDPTGDKVDFLARAARENGYRVVLCFIGLDSAAVSDERVTLRVTRGGHDVPADKLFARYSRTLANLARALAVLPSVYVYDNSDLAHPYRFLAEYQDGAAIRVGEDPPPAWFAAVLGGR